MNEDDTGSDIYLPWEIRTNRARQQRRFDAAGLALLPLIVAGIFAYAACVILGVL